MSERVASIQMRFSPHSKSSPRMYQAGLVFYAAESAPRCGRESFRFQRCTAEARLAFTILSPTIPFSGLRRSVASRCGFAASLKTEVSSAVLARRLGQSYVAIQVAHTSGFRLAPCVGYITLR